MPVAPHRGVFNPKWSAGEARRLRAGYAAAPPFPHIVIDDILTTDVARAISEEFPRPDSIEWTTFDHASSRKLACNDTRVMGPVTRRVVAEMASAPFVTFLEELTGISGLIPDPHLVGGGLHQILSGGFLGVHVDFNRHTHLNLDRRVNLLLYLNSEWRDEWNGHLELWDRDVRHRVHRIAPALNRCVIFNTSEHSFHGHPDPLSTPPGITRKSLALYYYTCQPDVRPTIAHSTIHRPRPGDGAVRVRTKRRSRPVRRFLLSLLPAGWRDRFVLPWRRGTAGNPSPAQPDETRSD